MHYAPDFMGLPGYKNPMVLLLWKMIYTNHKMLNRIKVNLKSFNQYSATTLDLKKMYSYPWYIIPVFIIERASSGVSWDVGIIWLEEEQITWISFLPFFY